MPLTEEQIKFINTHLEDVREQIIQVAEVEASKNAGKLEVQKLISIALEFAQSEPFPPRESTSVWCQITSVLTSVPGIIWVSAILTVTFGVLSAFYPASTSLSDMAKVFAGAIVGASGVSATTTRRP
ncbi:MAG: hypothetical protein WAW41_00295 [Methylobacter sp.]